MLQRNRLKIADDFSDMIYAKSTKEVATQNKPFNRKWRHKNRSVADTDVQRLDTRL